jgi:hypothetical protein
MWAWVSIRPGVAGMTVEVDDAGAGSIAREFQNFGVGADFHASTHQLN